MSVSLGINGFGRIGRYVNCRQLGDGVVDDDGPKMDHQSCWCCENEQCCVVVRNGSDKPLVLIDVVNQPWWIFCRLARLCLLFRMTH